MSAVPASSASVSVSVIVPCFNRADTVAEAIRSVLDQGWRDLEVIAVDDGSTDDSWAVMAAIADPRLRCLRNTAGKGVSSARNHGVANSSAPWVAFQDSDDLWLPDKLERQMAQLSGSDFVAAYCGMLVKEDTDPTTPVLQRHPDPDIAPLQGDILPSLIRGSYLSTQMLVIRRDVFDAVGGFDEDLEALVDWELMLRVAQHGPVAFIDADLVVQRMSANSITRSAHKRLLAQERVLSKHATLLQQYPGVLAQHHHRLAGAHKRSHTFAEAADHAGKALRTAPFNLRYALHSLYLRVRALLA